MWKPAKKMTIALLIFALLSGCTRHIPDRITQEDFPKPPQLKVISSTVKNDMEIPPDHDITLTFNNSMESVIITISGVKGSTTLQSNNTSAYFKAFSGIPDGVYTLTVAGKDEYGQEIQHGPITFSVKKGTIISPSLIAFSSNRDGDYEICLIRTDGSGLTQLTNNFSNDTQPVWSPNGKFIAFSSDRDGISIWNSDIIVMRSDGSGQTNLTNTPGINESDAFWSWDNKMIGFMSDIHGSFEYYVMNVDGTNQRLMTGDDMLNFTYPWLFGDLFLTWSKLNGNFEIFLEPADGTSEINLTNNPANDFWASWSPDGKKIAFTSDRDLNNEIYIMRSDGSEQKRVTSNFVDDVHPCWSPF